MKKWLLSSVLFICGYAVQAQCAACRATLESNLSNGELEVGSSINTGILYLFVAPYLTIGVVAFFWYRHSKSNAAS